MTPAERLTEQTRIRHALLKNGYTPLANVNKACMLTGWPGLQVDADQIEDWSGQRRYLATGVRVDGRLVVVDFDIDDEDVLDALWTLIPDDLRAVLDKAPVRFGGGDKMAVFLRLADGEGVFGRMVSQAYSPEGQDGTQRVEVFGSGSPRQFGVYGPRSHDEDGEVETEYMWADGQGLCEVDVAGLPEVSVKDLEVVCDAGSRAMREAGWTYEVKTVGGVVDGRPVFDLVDGMLFDTLEHGDDLDLGELEDVCEGVGAVRLSASWLEGPGAVNRSRCIARINAVDGRLQIWESAGCVLHRPADMDVHRKLEQLGERLSGRGGGGEDGGVASRWEKLQAQAAAGETVFSGSVEVDEEESARDEQAALDAQEAVIRFVLDRYAYWPDGSGYVVDVGSGPENAMSLGSFRNLMAPYGWSQKKSARKNAAVEEVNPADVWLKHSERRNVGGYRFAPGDTREIVCLNGVDYVNMWHAPTGWEGVEDADAVSVFQMFLEHLVPDERERDWFIGWLAAKVQKPWLPNCGVLMVAERQGAGRGTLFDILSGVFGPSYVSPVAAAQLIGGGSQSQYTDWLESSLLITCDEVLAGDDGGGAMMWKRREVYERLKALVDPRARMAAIVRKGLPNYRAEVFASYLLATNNVNALPLSADDRRFAVITNCARQLVERDDVMAGLARYRDERLGFSERFCAALVGWLRQVCVDWASVRESPRWMKGREEMLNANESDLDGVLENVLRRVEGDFVLGHHLRERLGRSLEANGLDGEIKGWWNKAQDILSRPNRLDWRKMNGRHRFDAPADQGSMGVTTVFYRESGAGVEAWHAVSPSERRPLWVGGDPSVRGSSARMADRLAEKGMRVVEKTPAK